MRLPLLLAASLALAACSSDPTDQNPPPPQDVQATDIGVDATDTGVDRLVVAAERAADEVDGGDLAEHRGEGRDPGQRALEAGAGVVAKGFA